MPAPLVRCRYDATDNGSLSVDISAFVKAFKVDAGRRSGLDKVRARRFSVELHNEGRFSPKNAASPLYPNFTQGKAIQLEARLQTGAAVATINDQHSFETDINGAYNVANVTLAQETTLARYGKACLRATCNSDAAAAAFGMRLRSGSRFAVTAALDYAVSFHMRSAGAFTFLVRIRWYNGAASNFQTDDSATMSSKEFWGKEADRYFVTKLAPATAVTCQVEIVEVSGWANTEIAYLDGFMFYQGSSQLVYCDGDQPGCVWTGTAHQSTASRGSAPFVALGTGFITGIDALRDEAVGVCHVEAVGLMDFLLDRYISFAGGLFDQKVTDILHCVLDRCEGDELIYDGSLLTRETIPDLLPGLGGAYSPAITLNGTIDASTHTVLYAGSDVVLAGENIRIDNEVMRVLAVDAGTNTLTVLRGWNGTVGAAHTTGVAIIKGYAFEAVGANAANMAITRDTANFVAIEGFWAGATSWASGTLAAGNGWRRYMTGETVGNVAYRMSVMLRSAGNNGKTVTVRMVDNVGTIDTKTVALSDSAWTRVTVEGAYAAGSTSRYIEVVLAETWTPVIGFGWENLHMVELADVIARDIRGTTATLKYVACYRRSARAFLDEIADSAGGIIWEKGDGTIVFEDYLTRSDTPVPALRITDAPEMDGLYGRGLVYSERLDQAYTTVEVFSDGDNVTVAGTAKDLWTLEPAQNLTAYQSRDYFVSYYADAGGAVLATSEPVATALLTAGQLVAVLFDYGVGADLTVYGGSAGATVTSLHILASIGQRASDRARVRYTPAGAAARRFRRTLQLDMPMQGSRSSVMTTVAQKVGDRYLSGQQAMDVTLSGLSLEEQIECLGRDMSAPVWLRHNNLPNALGLNEAYYIEGVRIQAKASERGYDLSATWTLERA